MLRKFIGSFTILLCIFWLSGCSPGPEGGAEDPAAEAPVADPVIDVQQTDDVYDPARDYFSFANSEAFTTRNLVLDLRVDLEKQFLDGWVVLELDRLDDSARQVVLDNRGLDIRSVSLLQAGQGVGDTGEPLSFSVGDADPVRGEPLTIDLPAATLSVADIRLKIRYRTGPDASAIMWLPAELTAGGEWPFMFTQSQSIHARSWIPLQDTPAVRATYQATIRTPPALLALMSADNDPAAERDGIYRFSMPQPIPSYLMALAVGNVYFAPLGEQTGVYAEPEVLEAAAWEFADTQQMMDVAEAIYGPYDWGRYDLIILPPSFPYGGMENPRLSFITPSVIAGDRSLVSLIAHELAHSWSGNLVSNATWRDIWLNEGTTSYLEARLMEVLFGKQRADEERTLSYQNLLRLIKTTPPAMQALAPRLDGDDPEAQGGLEYSKGQLLLETLEQRFGRERFDKFMSEYFRHFAYQAITTEQFLNYLDQNLLRKHPGLISRAELETWLYRPGIPASANIPQSRNLEQAAKLAVDWSKGERALSSIDFSSWSPQAMVNFIESLPAELEPAALTELDDALKFSQSNNAEIARSWFIQVAQRRFEPAYPAMRDYLQRFGRTRLIEPVYKALVENGQDGELARQLFQQSLNNYHPLTRAAIEKVLVPAS